MGHIPAIMSEIFTAFLYPSKQMTG